MGLFSGDRPVRRQATRAGGPGVGFQWPYPAPRVDYSRVSAAGDGAYGSVAIDVGIDLIASLVAELPLDVFRGRGKDKVELPVPGNLQDPGNDQYGLEDWLYRMVNSGLYRGNLYGEEVAWDSQGRARQISLFHPDDIRPNILEGKIQWWVNGRLWDRPELFVHRRYNPVPGRLLGASMIERHAIQIGQSLQAASFGTQWFSDGAHPSGILTTDQEIDKTDAEEVKQRWMAKMQGSREPAVLGKAWQWQQISISPNESQFLETQRYSEAQCARILGPGVAEVLGYETGGSMTYANVVDRRLDLLTFTVGKWLSRAERLLSGLLPNPQYARFNRDALLESATLARYQTYALALQNKWMTINEVRDLEDRRPVAWGDEPQSAGPAPTAQQGPTTN